jgi:NAD(P)-dependent dehydrogenase (short-subunit alcohol dehydrogenase family)
MKTILITGSSSGFGHETARLFHDRGWRVIATMRHPKPGILPASDRIVLQQLDVTDAASIADCVAAVGPIDALVNNAGLGLVGAFEATPMAQVRKIFDTNTFGVMAVTQAFVPVLRTQGGGVIVNVTSSVALAASPYTSVYTASKTAVEGFSGSLALELEPFAIRVKLVEPGHGPTTRFAASSDIRSRT